MNFVGIIILAIIVLFGIGGMRSGLVRKFHGVLALILSSLLVSILLPYTTQFLKEKTPVYDFLVQRGEELVSTHLVERAVMNAAGTTGNSQGGSAGSGLSIADILPDAGWAEDGSAALSALDQLSKVEQTRLIKAMPLPAFVQRIMINFNNNDGYKKLNAGGFAQYLISFVVNLIVNIIGFFVTMLVTWLIVRGILSALDLVARIPFLYSINRIGGLAAGIIEGLFVVWILFLIVSMFSGTAAGARIIELIHENTLLAPIYEGNIFLRIITGAVTHIL